MCSVKSQALLRANLFHGALNANSRKIKEVNARNSKAVKDRAGNNSPTENGFSGNGEIVGHGEQGKKGSASREKHLKKKGREDQSQET